MINMINLDCNISITAMNDLIQLFKDKVFLNLECLIIENENQRSYSSFVSSFQSNHWKLFLDCLRDNCCLHLHTLSMPNCKINNDGFIEFCKIYHDQEQWTLRQLNFSNCHIGSKGIEAFCQLCQERNINCTLEKLDLSENKIHTTGFMALGLLFHTLSFPCLKSLNLSSIMYFKCCDSDRESLSTEGNQLLD